MSTLSIREYQNELQEVDRFREVLKVEIGQSYINRIGESVIIVGDVNVPGWQITFFIDPQGRRYDKFGYSYEANTLPPSNFDLVAIHKPE